MNFKRFVLLALLIPVSVLADARSDSARVGVVRANSAVSRMPGMVSTGAVNTVKAPESTTKVAAVVSPATPAAEQPKPAEPENSTNCRDAYRACMDDFCLLDESEGYRCACSDNINQAKSLIQEIQSLQSDADKLFTEGVERENLGAKASLVFGESAAAKKSYALSGISFADWLNSGSDGDVLTADDDIGGNLYAMASEYCAAELKSCANRAEMEEVLYSRMIVADCKSYDAYLADQKANAQANKRTAESAVRQARLEMLDTTNKYNRGECLLAYKSCIADKGGCGTNFENCLDESLLERRAYACENVLDQCMAVKNYVLSDWDDEAQMILVDAAKYADKNQRATCLAKIQNCLEESCSTSTNSACLTDVNVAAGICPIITECEQLIPGIQSVVNSKLGYLRTQFCQNDVDACLQQKCGTNFTAPECLGKSTSQIVALCPQNMFPSCAGETQFDVIISAALLQMDYQMMQGCVNYFGTQLNSVCGTDMSCLPNDDTVTALSVIPSDDSEMIALRDTVRANAGAAVDEFFKQFEQDVTVSACVDSQQPVGSQKQSLGASVFNSAKMIAQINAENRALRALESKIAELSRRQDLAAAEKNCLTTYAVETPDKDSKNYSYIRSVSFEPSLRNCHVCRMQQVCETGGESKATSALKAAAGGLSGGAAAGTMVTPGWGTAIGAVVGAVGAGLVGMASGGKEDFCQELESCEDINM
ncbi:MAG: hypothetical protein KBS86_01085 [Proteobacteria bacterium]|nr:hypothetical protein [Candidatus Enterousia scatequi]